MEDLTGKQLGSYRIVAQIGEGGMASVFKSYQPKMDRYIALKILPRHLSKNSEFVERFSQEARVIARLEHPHILPVFDFGEEDGYTYLAMRLVEGGSLGNLLKKNRQLKLPQIARFIAQVGGALDYAHKQGVIHRDFKPGNVLLDNFENCLLTDFGIAKLMAATTNLTATGGILGTPAYISPEQGMGEKIDHRSDIYSLGVVLYQMVTGYLPYKADTPMAVIFQHIHAPLPLPREKVPDLPDSIERIILKSLSKNADDRFESAAEMVNALEHAVLNLDYQPTQDDAETITKPDETEVTEIAIEQQEVPERQQLKPTLEPEPAVVRQESTKRKQSRWGYGILSLAVLVSLTGLAWFFFIKPQPAQSPVPYIDSEPQEPKIKSISKVMDSNSKDVVDTDEKIKEPSVTIKEKKATQITKDKKVSKAGRFVKLPSSVVRDNMTGLEWFAGPDRDISWRKAKSWVATLRVDGGGWRMPTIKELKALYQEGVGSRNITPLLETKGLWVWSGESKGPSTVWHYYLRDGKAQWIRHTDSISLCRAFAVRSPQLSSTTLGKEVKKDGHYIKYEPGIVKDTKTGLEWYIGPDKDTNWNEAKSWVRNLKVGGGGWRMPTIKQLTGLWKKNGVWHTTSLIR
jgi:serine/threonine protein kinase